MTVFVPAGAATSALTHFALYGLAAILEDENGQSVRVCWTDEADPKPQLDAELEPGEVAAAVHRHATRCASPESWLGVRFDAGDRHFAAFSPRIATPSTPSAWHHLQETRHAGLDAVAAAGSELDLRMIGALGEPAYWPLEPKSARGAARSDGNSDGGASRWEMKTRNQGAEFVGNRLLPMARVVAARTVDEVLSGLAGYTIRDEVGNDKPESRSGTGFTRPGPVDNALAWCALWGISQFPVVHHNGAQSTTAGTYVPARRTYPTFVFLPVPTRLITLSRLRSILASRQLQLAATTTDSSDPLDVISAEAARRWLTERSIRALMRFPLYASETKVPERKILDGSVVTLTNSASPWN